MQVGSDATAMAMRQISKSAQMMNELNQKIVDESQSMAGKMLRVVVQEKIAAGQTQQKLDLLA